jgi:hypothetical protein
MLKNTVIYTNCFRGNHKTEKQISVSKDIHSVYQVLVQKGLDIQIFKVSGDQHIPVSSQEVDFENDEAFLQINNLADSNLSFKEFNDLLQRWGINSIW